ncbi:MAG: O-acetyl-ADP-ribose deacetylase [Rhodospirillaceae bacterium]
MAIVVNLDLVLVKRKMKLSELAARVNITLANLSVLKQNRARAVRFSTLDALCRELGCQPGDLLEYQPDAPGARDGVFRGTRMTVVRGDITGLEVDAIVNAANTSLLGGGGVDGAIHRAAGPELLAACRTIGGCPTGQARMTAGYRLPARHVIHTAGPAYGGGGSREADALRSCYRESLRLGEGAGLQSVAFPCISTGIYGYPKAEACEIAVSEVAQWLEVHALPARVLFCCFDEEDARLYRRRLTAIGS